MHKIFLMGSSNTDMVVKPSRLPALGETTLGGAFLMKYNSGAFKIG
jgi:ribokinase